MGESALLKSGLPCEACGSSDAVALYDDGHSYCFSCKNFEHEEERDAPQPARASGFLQPGEYRDLPARKLTADTCRRWGYFVTEVGGTRVQVAEFRNPDGELIAQKTRDKDKNFKLIQDGKKPMPLFGMQVAKPDKENTLIITEGELDAMSIWQSFDRRKPSVVSLPNGAASCAKVLKEHLRWICRFGEVVLWFDNDGPGREAKDEACKILPLGSTRIAAAPSDAKDANELLQQGRIADIRAAIWGAPQWRPDGVVTAADVAEAAKKTATMGLSWPFPELTRLTHGVRRGECYAFGAGTGVGKTDLFTECVAHLLSVHNLPVGCIFLEQSNRETLRRIAGKLSDKPFHIPDGGWTEQELGDAIDRLSVMPLYLYDHFGAAEWDTIEVMIRYMVTGMGVKDIFLDHLTALAAAESNEREGLERIMSRIGSLVQELDFSMYFISHLATPDQGKSHEEGGRVTIRQFKGSRAIGFWSHFMFGLERDQQADDVSKRHLTTFRVLKDRYTGQATGATFHLKYDATRGRLLEADVMEDFMDVPF